MAYKIRHIDYYNADYVNQFYNKIYTIKKNKIPKYRRNTKAISSIVGEIILSELLKENYDINYTNLSFGVNPNGKPFIKNKKIYFNISHFATDKEQLYILSSNNDIEKRLFQIYTLKEAYFKMKGNNLNKIKDIEFTFKDNDIICSDKNVSAYFIDDIDGYVIAVCEK